MTRTCGLCGAAAASFFRERVLQKYDVQVFRCPGCDLIQTEEPHWLEEAYASALSALDTGVLQRTESTARLTRSAAVLLGLPATARVLDWGGGHGLLVRRLRDLGLDARWWDPRAENLLAAGFSGDPAERFELVTAFEVVEHFAQPAVELERLFAARPPAVLLGTLLHRGEGPCWWYYTPESGQHVSFYSRRTMEFVGERHGYSVLAGPTATLLLERASPFGPVRRRLLSALLGHLPLAEAALSILPEPLVARMLPYRSRTQEDHAAMRDRGRG